MAENERDIAVLRRRWDEGKASGRAGRIDIARLIAEEKERLSGPQIFRSTSSKKDE